MECRKVLLATRKQREEELRAYEILSAKFDDSHIDLPLDLIKKRQAILSLELPFMTDAVSVNEARAYGSKIMDADSNTAALIKIGKIRDHTSKMEEDWVSSSHCDDSYLRQSFINSMKNHNIYPQVSVDGKEAGLVNFDDFVYETPRQALLQGIEQSEFKTTTKRVYRSMAKNMIDFACRGKRSFYKSNATPKLNVSIYTIAHYFDYLERRCLNSFSIDGYLDLLEIRLIFYVHLNSSEIGQLTLTNIDSSSMCLNFNGKKYPLPLSFISLLKSLFTENAQLVRKNAKQLDKFVSQTSQAQGANLQEKITPLQIKQSLASIYQSEGFSDIFLPRR